MPLGSGAIAGTAYDIDTAWLATRLGFARVVANSIDASAIATSSRRSSTPARWRWSTRPAGRGRHHLLDRGIRILRDRTTAVATGSSLMPQKKNPDPLELVRGKSGKAIGMLTGWLATMKGLPLGYNKDLQEDKAVAFDAEDTLIACTAAYDGRRSNVVSPTGRRAHGRVGTAARDRGRRLSRRPRPALPHRARSHRPHCARPGPGGQGLFVRRRVSGQGNHAPSMRARQGDHPGCRGGCRTGPRVHGPQAVARALGETKAWLTRFTSDNPDRPLESARKQPRCSEDTSDSDSGPSGCRNGRAWRALPGVSVGRIPSGRIWCSSVSSTSHRSRQHRVHALAFGSCRYSHSPAALADGSVGVHGC